MHGIENLVVAVGFCRHICTIVILFNASGALQFIKGGVI